MKLTWKNSLALIGTAGLITVSLAACGTNNGDANNGSTGNSGGTTSSAPATTPSAAPTPLAQIDSVTGVHTQVTLDKGFTDALTSLKLTPGVLGKATLSKEGVLTFPITGGNVTYYDPASKVANGYVQGELDHAGSGISLTAGDTTVKLTDFVIHPQSGSTITGSVQVNNGEVLKDVTIFTLDGSTLNPATKDSDGNTVLEGTRVLISPDAAALLNKTFKTDAVTGGNDGLLVGIAKLTVK